MATIDPRTTRAMNPFWRTDEPGRLLLSCLRSRPHADGVLFRNTRIALPAVAPKITRIAFPRRETRTMTKRRFLCATYIQTYFFFPPTVTNVLVALTYSAYFSELTPCPRSFINPPPSLVPEPFLLSFYFVLPFVRYVSCSRGSPV